MLETLFVPTVRALADAGRPFRGLLYGGLMLTPDRGPMVHRMELPLRRSRDAVGADALRRAICCPGCAGVAAGRCRRARRASRPGAAVCVVLAAGGYPGTPRAGDAITGLPPRRSDDVVVFHAGTRRDGDGPLLTAGGRVLGVTASAPTSPRRAPAPTARSRASVSMVSISAETSACEGVREHERANEAIDVAIMMGSKSDLETMRPAAKVLEALGLAVEVRVLSAHRTPEEAAAFVKDAGTARRQGVHLRRGRRGAPGGRGRGAHHPCP